MTKLEQLEGKDIMPFSVDFFNISYQFCVIWLPLTKYLSI